MSQEPSATVQIVFNTPPRSNGAASAPTHKRQLEGVPSSVAQKMVQDSAEYARNPSEENRRKMYTYQKNGHVNHNGHGHLDQNGEVFATLDFEEISDLEVLNGHPGSHS